MCICSVARESDTARPELIAYGGEVRSWIDPMDAQSAIGIYG